MAAPLALDLKAHGQSAGWRRNEDLIDALPYFDTLAPEAKKQVDTLIEEELRRSTKKPADYLREMPAVPSNVFEGHPLLAAEYERWVCMSSPCAPCTLRSHAPPCAPTPYAPMRPMRP